MKLWNFLTHLGVTEELSPLQAKRFILFNQVVLVSILSVEISVPLFYFGVLPFQKLYPVQFSFLFFGTLCLFLMYRRRYGGAKLTAILLAPFWFVAMCVVGGPDSGFQFLFALLILIPFLLLNPLDRGLFWTSQSLNVLAMAVVLYWFFYREPLEGVPAEHGDRIYYYHILNVCVLLFLYVYYISRTSYRAEVKLEAEQAKSERLLLNVLPAQVAGELKETGSARPVRFENVSVLFTDFHGFTRIAENLAPEELVRELDECFSFFDEVARRHGLEKIKTIGDAYMAAAGIPVSNESHAVDCVLAALEIREFMATRAAEKEAAGRPFWGLRLGIHSGPLVAGVIGRSKFAYDVFGDTVNVASRVESASETGRINISAATYASVREFFDCESRGNIPVKNRGEIEMFFVNGVKPGLNMTGAYAARFG